MWTSNTMSVSQSLLISVMGLVVVVIALTLLAVMITLFSKMFEFLNNRGRKPAIPQSEHQQGLTDEEIGAAIISIVCEDLCTEPENIRITSIREI